MSLPHLARCGSLAAFLLVCPLPALSQQVDCTVNVNYEAVATSNKDLLRDFENDIRNYVNNYQWGEEQLDEKVKCTIDVFIQNVTGENRKMNANTMRMT